MRDRGVTAVASVRIARTDASRVSGGLRCGMAVDFSAEVVRRDEEIVILLRGSIDIETAGHLRDLIEPHMGPAQSIVLDLSDVDFMDSSCLKVLVQARGRLTADGGSLVLRNPSTFARQLLTVAKAQGILDDDFQLP